jgi:hypothetical protein
MMVFYLLPITKYDNGLNLMRMKKLSTGKHGRARMSSDKSNKFICARPRSSADK